MNLIEALKTCKETGGKLVKDSWTTDVKDYCDYTIPVYICWNSNEEAFVAVLIAYLISMPGFLRITWEAS